MFTTTCCENTYVFRILSCYGGWKYQYVYQAHEFFRTRTRFLVPESEHEPILVPECTSLRTWWELLSLRRGEMNLWLSAPDSFYYRCTNLWSGQHTLSSQILLFLCCWGPSVASGFITSRSRSQQLDVRNKCSVNNFFFGPEPVCRLTRTGYFPMLLIKRCSTRGPRMARDSAR